MNFIGIIPARFQSTRFPGKPLAILGNKPIIQWVYENAKIALTEVFVATDDERIYKTVVDFGGKAVYTSANHQSGTDRCAEAASKIAAQGILFDVVVNIQGDEPFVRPEQIDSLKSCFDHPSTEIATLIKPIANADEITNINRPKVVINKNLEAMYFSRSPIPFVRDCPVTDWAGRGIFYGHVGIYAYRSDILHELAQLQPGIMEKAESLEQLRWLENGYRIKTAQTSFENIGIDTPDDLENARKFLKA